MQLGGQPGGDGWSDRREAVGALETGVDDEDVPGPDPTGQAAARLRPRLDVAVGVDSDQHRESGPSRAGWAEALGRRGASLSRSGRARLARRAGSQSEEKHAERYGGPSECGRSAGASRRVPERV